MECYPSMRRYGAGVYVVQVLIDMNTNAGNAFVQIPVFFA